MPSNVQPSQQDGHLASVNNSDTHPASGPFTATDDPAAAAADDSAAAAAGSESDAIGTDVQRPLLNPFTVLNVRGLKPRSVPSKVPFIQDIVDDSSQMFLALTETWLCDHHDAELHVEGYTLFRQDRQRKKKNLLSRSSGGVCLYLNDKDAIDTEVILTFSNGVLEALGVFIKVRNLIVVVVYRQPDDPKGGNRSGSKEFKNFLNELNSVLNNLPSPTPDVVVCGDFNLPHACWTSGTCRPGATKEEQIMFQDLFGLANEQFLMQTIEKSTHRLGNTLDLVFVNNTNIIHSYSSNVTSISDHHILECNTVYVDNAKDSNNSSFHECKKDDDLSFSDFNFFNEDIDWSSLNSALSETNWHLHFRNSSPEDMMTTFLDSCLEIVKRFVPLRRQSSKNGSARKSRIPRHRRTLMRNRRRIQKQITSCTSDTRRMHLNQRLIEIEKSLQSSHKAQREEEESIAVQRIKTNSKFFYSYAKRFSSTHVGIGPLLDATDQLTSCSETMCEILSEQYASVFSTPACDQDEMNDLFDDATLTRNGIHDIDFGEEDIIEAMSEFSTNSAAGPDGFPAMMLKMCKESLAHPLFLIWRHSLNQGILPNSCKIANIVPIHKGKSRAIAKNYRPVALTSLLIKTFEKVIRKQLVNYLDEHHLFNDNQSGFRGARSCLSQLLTHFDHVTRLLEQGKVVDVIYLDFAKAFDKVDIGITLKKLKSLGIHGRLGKWLQCFLTDRSQSVVVNGTRSHPKPVISGVPQGSVLGPLLFLVLIGDIDKNVSEAFLSSFADDTRVGHGIKKEEDTHTLQNDLQIVYQWAVQNNMEFNSEKFEHLRYTPNKMIPDSFSSQYQSNLGTPITQKEHVRDLGVTLSDDATFKQYISEKSTKMKSKIGWILRTFQTRDLLPMLTLWKSLVLSEHDYCCQLWSPQKIGIVQSIEIVQHFYLKRIYGFSHLTYWEQLCKSKLYSLERRRERYIAMYTWKMLEGLVPNIATGTNAIVGIWHPRRGRECHGPSVAASAPSRIRTIRYASFSINGPRIFNSLPQYVRDTTNCDNSVFKARLDHYLTQIPDQPLIPGYTAYRQCDTNSIVDWSNNAQCRARLEEPSHEDAVWRDGRRLSTVT